MGNSLETKAMPEQKEGPQTSQVSNELDLLRGVVELNREDIMALCDRLYPVLTTTASTVDPSPYEDNEQVGPEALAPLALDLKNIKDSISTNNAALSYILIHLEL